MTACCLSTLRDYREQTVVLRCPIPGSSQGQVPRVNAYTNTHRPQSPSPPQCTVKATQLPQKVTGLYKVPGPTPSSLPNQPLLPRTPSSAPCSQCKTLAPRSGWEGTETLWSSETGCSLRRASRGGQPSSTWARRKGDKWAAPWHSSQEHPQLPVVLTCHLVPPSSFHGPTPAGLVALILT